LLASIAAVIALPWITYHGWINDWQTEKRAAAYAELTAVPELKPSVQASPNSFPLRALRTKGVSLWYMVFTLPWLEWSFRSFCGLYGWMNVVAVSWIYRVFGSLYVALLAILAVPAFKRRPQGARALLGALIVCGALVVAQSVYWSWVRDFQPQGRYLFPILPMLFFYQRQCDTASIRVPSLIVMMLLGFHGLLSFGMVGLSNLACGGQPCPMR
jgi:hypothetical protein